MVTWRSALTIFIQKLELYELANIIMFLSLSVIFIVNGAKIHDTLGLHTTSYILWGNIKAVYESSLAWVFTLYLLLSISIYTLSKNTNRLWLQRARNPIRLLASFCSMMAIYKIIIFYIRVNAPMTRDGTLQHIDNLLFGGKLLSQWIAPIVNPYLTVFFFIVYMSWFAMTYITLFFMWRHSQKAVQEYVAATIMAFCIGYIAYTIVPAIGPIFTVHYSNSLGNIVKLLTGDESYIPRDCFPSLHTGISIVMLVFIHRYRRDLFKGYVVIASLIIISTQYLRVHYGIDVIAGAALGISMSIFAPNWVRKWASAKNAFQRTDASNIPATHSTESISELV